MGLQIVPVFLREARVWVGHHHRHNDPPEGHMFSASVELEGERVGVAIASRPVARGAQDGTTVEIVRVCVEEGAPKNACSKLYGALCRAAKALGYRRAITYTLASEAGVSLRAAGFVPVAELEPRNWAAERRNAVRGQLALLGEPAWEDRPRIRWERLL